MPNAKVTAPASPDSVRAKRSEELRAKGTKRTPAETSELIDVLAARVDALEGK